MEVYRKHINVTSASASTSMAQQSQGPHGFLFRASTSQTEEPETPNFSQAMGQSFEEEREISHSRPRSALFEHTILGVTSQVVPPTSTASYLSEEVTNEIYRPLERHHLSFRSLQTSSVYQTSFPNYHQNPLTTPTHAYTCTTPLNPTTHFPTQNSFTQYHATPTYHSMQQTMPSYTTYQQPQYPETSYQPQYPEITHSPQPPANAQAYYTPHQSQPFSPPYNPLPPSYHQTHGHRNQGQQAMLGQDIKKMISEALIEAEVTTKHR